MDTRRLDLGLVENVDAESFGEPGQRTFRLHAKIAEGSVSLWLEKEQVAMLGSAIEELLDRLPDEYGLQPVMEGPRSFVGDLEVKVGSLAIGYDPDHSAFTVEAGEFTSPFDLESISFFAARHHFVRMRDQIDEIVSASRPRCVLCGTPLGGGPHFCPESNGHTRTARHD